MGYSDLSAFYAAVATNKQRQIFLHTYLKTAFVHAAADPQILAIQYVLLSYTFIPG
jgi:hypothetical protein